MYSRMNAAASAQGVVKIPLQEQHCSQLVCSLCLHRQVDCRSVVCHASGLEQQPVWQELDCIKILCVFTSLLKTTTNPLTTNSLLTRTFSDRETTYLWPKVITTINNSGAKNKYVTLRVTTLARRTTRLQLTTRSTQRTQTRRPTKQQQGHPLQATTSSPNAQLSSFEDLGDDLFIIWETCPDTRESAGKDEHKTC